MSNPTPCVVFYRVEEGAVTVVAVVHGKRLLETNGEAES